MFAVSYNNAGVLVKQMCHALLNVGSANYYHSNKDVKELRLLAVCCSKSSTHFKLTTSLIIEIKIRKTGIVFSNLFCSEKDIISWNVGSFRQLLGM